VYAIIAAVEALLDVTVAATPDVRLGRIAGQIGDLNNAWKRWHKATRAGSRHALAAPTSVEVENG